MDFKTIEEYIEISLSRKCKMLQDKIFFVEQDIAEAIAKEATRMGRVEGVKMGVREEVARKSCHPDSWPPGPSGVEPISKQPKPDLSRSYTHENPRPETGPPSPKVSKGESLGYTFSLPNRISLACNVASQLLRVQAFDGVSGPVGSNCPKSVAREALSVVDAIISMAQSNE